VLSCAELLDIPDKPVLTADPATSLPAEPTDTSPDDHKETAVSAVEGQAIGLETSAGEARPAPSLMSGDDPPIVVAIPIDAALDAGLDDGERVTDAAADSGPKAPVDDPPTACAGQPLFGICWYLGAVAESCEGLCSAHGGYADAATRIAGARAQGGSPETCTAILRVLGADAPARTALRLDGVGVGCHTFGLARNPYWLITPSFDPSARLRLARIACGCVE
jgi:hypothetical protein